MTTPAVPPCSSITITICVRSRRIVDSTASSGAVSGTSGSGRACAADRRSSRSSTPQQILDVDHADDVIEIAARKSDSACAASAEDSPDLRRASLPSGMPMTRTRGTIDLASREVAELEQLLQHLPGLGANRAQLLALLDDQLQLLGRVGPLRRSAPGG